MPKFAYLTIDDGPSTFWEKKLDHLISRGVAAIWFCTGKAMETHPDFAHKAIAAGHIIANHSFNHPYFSDTSLENCYSQIQNTDRIIEETYSKSGVTRPAKYFRFPYGDKGGYTHDEVLEPYGCKGTHRKEVLQNFLRKLGYTQPAFSGITYVYYHRAGLLADADWHWTYDCREWELSGANSLSGLNNLDMVFERMEENAPECYRGLNHEGSEDIVLIHDHVNTTEMFPPIIDRLLSKGIEFRSEFETPQDNLKQ